MSEQNEDALGSHLVAEGHGRAGGESTSTARSAAARTVLPLTVAARALAKSAPHSTSSQGADTAARVTARLARDARGLAAGGAWGDGMERKVGGSEGWGMACVSRLRGGPTKRSREPVG